MRGNRLLDSFSISCSEFGVCQRSDGFQLIPGYQSINKVVVKYVENTNFTNIFSIDPFANAKHLGFLKRSDKYVCADGFKECILACCDQGFCKGPVNTCKELDNLGDKSVYGPCLAYLIFAIAYWVVFIYLGIRYNKRNSNIVITKSEGKLNNFETEFPDNFTRNKSNNTNTNSNNFNSIDKNKEYYENENIPQASTNRVLNNEMVEVKVPNKEKLYDLEHEEASQKPNPIKLFAVSQSFQSNSTGFIGDNVKNKLIKSSILSNNEEELNREYNSNYLLNNNNILKNTNNEISTVNSNNFYANNAINVSKSNATMREILKKNDKIDKLNYKDGDDNHNDEINMKKITELNEQD